MASPQLQALVAGLRAGQPVDWSPTGRIPFEQAVTALPGPPETRSEPVSAGGVSGEWIDAGAPNAARVLFYLHGGGYTIGSVNAYRPLIARLCLAAGARGLAIDYRLAPEHPFPAAVDDATGAYRWLIGSGINPERVVIAGDSAGGGLTIATLVALREAGDQLPAAAVVISPWIDLQIAGESAITRADADPVIHPADLRASGALYLGSADPRSPLASPLYADLTGLPSAARPGGRRRGAAR